MECLHLSYGTVRQHISRVDPRKHVNSQAAGNHEPSRGCKSRALKSVCQSESSRHGAVSHFAPALAPLVLHKHLALVRDLQRQERLKLRFATPYRASRWSMQAEVATAGAGLVGSPPAAG